MHLTNRLMTLSKFKVSFFFPLCIPYFFSLLVFEFKKSFDLLSRVSELCAMYKEGYLRMLVSCSEFELTI